MGCNKLSSVDRQQAQMVLDGDGSRSDVTRVLVHTGFAKAGTTYLQEWFARHPSLRFCADGIGGFGNVFDLNDAAHEKSWREYSYYVTSNEVLGSGGRIPYGCPLYSFRMMRDVDMRSRQRKTIRILKHLFPEAKVLVVTRGYNGIIRSLYSQYVKLGGRRRFNEFLDRYWTVMDQWLDVDFNLDLHRAAFGDQLLVLPYELLADRPDEFFRCLESFLGVKPCDDPPRNRNQSLTHDQLYWYALLSRWIVSPFAELFGTARAANIYLKWSFGVVQPNRLGGLIRLLGRLTGRTEDLSIPTDYLERFRGKADSLAESELHRPYLDRYLVSPSTAQLADSDSRIDRT